MKIKNNMIKGINSGGRYITVTGGSPATTYVNNYSGQGVGNMRYNTSSQQMEVYDGSTWQMLTMNYATVDLTFDAQQALDWVQQQRAKELKRTELIKKNPALQKAYEAIQRAEANFDILEKFVENDNDAGQVQSSP